MKSNRCVECGEPFTGADRGRPRRYCSRACQARAYRARKDTGTSARRGSRGGSVPRTALDRTTIVRDAIRLADAEGPGAVSMRVLADRNGVPAMSLYKYVASKDDLVSAMIDTVLVRHWRPADSGRGWRERLEHEARQEWELYQHHHWLLPLLATTRPPLSPPVLAGIDRSMTALTDQGLDAETALSVYLTISSYVQGAALLPIAERQATQESVVSSRHWWHRRLGQLAGAIEANRYPWLTALASTPAAHGPSDEDTRAWFEFGLRRVLDGIAAFLASRGTPD